ncbi:MAG: PAS domain-containing protein [Alphaproteobacteria bacterium]|nr:PAS domain-containing protein [Alphaproteobacteria bacterium]
MEQPEAASPSQAISIVGIGASAGGLDALKHFFKNAPRDCGLAFVVITHRDPEGTSILPDILKKCTTLPVAEAQNGVTLEPNHIYTSPPSHYLRLQQDRLLFDEIPADRGASLPIDYFFRSLAEEKKEKAICVILSGAGSDGTIGMHAVHGEGGMAMAQEIKTAEFGDMPGSAIASGLVDYVLPPDKMPGHIVAYVQGLKPDKRRESTPLLQHEALDEMLALLRQHTGSDFAFYKTNTLGRRIERRMNVHHLADPAQYVRYLKENVHEIDLLFKELLIGVTSYFRDPAAFEILETEALPALLQDKAGNDAVRIWVAGCSTGEEAYSLAILLHEYMEREKKQFHVQIFATDLDDKAINHARVGLYSDGIALDVKPERLARYFNREDNHYRIKKNIREMVVFATQNLIQDPPFTKLDLVSCRNLMIYLDSPMQKKIIPLFHYSLRAGGLLLLGSSETVGTFTDLFAPLHGRWKLFTRREMPLSVNRLTKFMDLPRVEDNHYAAAATGKSKGKAADISELAQKLLLKQYIPPSLIVNEKGDIFFIHGRTGTYLEPSSGPPQPNQNALDMAREGLQLALTAIIRKAASQDTEAVHKGVRVRTNGHFAIVNLRAKKILEPEALRGLIWIAFEREDEEEEFPAGDTPAGSGKKMKPKRKPQQIDNEQVERELQFVKQNLQNTIEELEASNEELKSTNEELQSTNEELQSANEELETAKEEMQSLNEELQTVNAELETKISDLSYANDDMKNLLNSTGIATVFLDNGLNIKRFTIQTKKIIHLIQTDIGRPISDIVSQLEYTALVRDASEVLQTLVFKEIEVRAKDWSWYLMRIMPYRTAENVIDGLVLTFVDITKLKKSEILLAAHIKTLELMCIKEAPLVEVLTELLRAVENQSSGVWCSVVTLDSAGKHLRHVAAPTLPEAFNKVLDGIEVSAGATEPCAMAIASRKHIVVPDIGSALPQTAFTKLALKHDVKACWSQPIMSSAGKVLGAFTIYYQQAHQPSNVEEELINQAVPIMATAIERSSKGRK